MPSAKGLTDTISAAWNRLVTTLGRPGGAAGDLPDMPEPTAPARMGREADAHKSTMAGWRAHGSKRD